MGKWGAVVDVLRKGGEVANVEAWKRGTINVNVVVAFLAALVALAKACGLSLDITYEQLGYIATILVAVVALVNSVLTAATSKRAGLPGLVPNVEPVAEEPAPAPAPQPVDPIWSGGAQPATPEVPGVPDERTNPFRDHGA